MAVACTKWKITLPIFAKRIGPKYFQNLRMVLSYLCNNDKICGKKLPVSFRCKCISKWYCVIQFFLVKETAVILGKLSSFSASYQLFLLLLNNHFVFCKDRKQTLEVPWSRIASVIWHYYLLNVLMSAE